MIKIYNFSILGRYVSRDFIKITINVTLIFFCLGVILNLFDEINFFKERDLGLLLPFYLSVMKIPSIIHNLFPFIILISAIWLFLKIIRTDEMTAMKIAGLSNLNIILIPSFIALFLGIFFILGLSPITSALTLKYMNIKANYTQGNEYLASITINGIWIKEKKNNKINILRSSNLKGSTLMNVSIYQFDENNNPINRIEAKSADIKTTDWLLYDVTILGNQEEKEEQKIDRITYESTYDLKGIKHIYSNLETVSFWDLNNLMKLYQERGYSTKEIETEFQRATAFPFFLFSMVLLAGVSILGIKFRGGYMSYVFFAIISSVIIYYFNDFSKALGDTDRLPVILSVWIPVIIIFVFSSIGLIHVNQK